MDNTIRIIWDAIVKESEKLAKKNNVIVMYEDSYDVFRENFYYYKGLIQNNFMKEKSDNLDRHKVAAIIICSILNNDLLGVSAKKSGEHSDELFLANEKIAVNVALSYMYDELKISYLEGEVPYKKLFEKYRFPKPYSCEREYDQVICRDLYYTKSFFKLNPLSLANFLFLLEDYSFNAYRIERMENKED